MASGLLVGRGELHRVQVREAAPAELADGATAVLSSASSRTGMGLACMLAEGGVPPVGPMSPRNAEFVRGTGLYSQVVEYKDVDTLEVDGPAAFVDMAGDAAVRGAVDRHLGERLVHSAVVGSTHHAAPATGDRLPGAPPTFFFTPDRIVNRRDRWGGGEVNSRIADAMARFIAAADWLSIRHDTGPDEVTTIYCSILAGEASPAVGDIVRPDKTCLVTPVGAVRRVDRSGRSARPPCPVAPGRLSQ